MTSPPLIDIASFMGPIPGDEPAGVPLPYVVRQKLDEWRKDADRNPDDPNGDPIPKKPEWTQIINTTTELLLEKSKDLNVAARLTEALARHHGFGGLRDGLRLLGDLVEQCWDNDAALEKPRLHPAPDEGEGMEVRNGPFHWLCDTDRGARFPNNVKELPLLKVDGTPQSYLGKKRADDGKSETPKSAFKRAVPWKTETKDDLNECLDQMTRIDALLNNKLEKKGPDVGGLRLALEECQGLLQQYLPKDSGNPPDPGPSGDPTPPPPNGLLTTRDEAYAELTRIAELLERLEPHSPIPDFIRRAVDMGKMPFKKLVRELIRDPNQLNELRREFGIKGEEEVAAEAPPAAE